MTSYKLPTYQLLLVEPGEGGRQLDGRRGEGGGEAGHQGGRGEGLTARACYWLERLDALLIGQHYSPAISEAETGDTAVRPGLVRVEPAPRDPGPGPCWLVDTDNPAWNYVHIHSSV